MIAVMTGQMEATEFLLRNGADVSLTNERHESAFTLAKSMDYTPICALLAKVQMGNIGKVRAATSGQAEEVLCCSWGCGFRAPVEVCRVVSLKDSESTTSFQKILEGKACD